MDLFDLDSPLLGHIQNDRLMMAYCFFHLERGSRNRPIIYDDGKVRIEVFGQEIATIWDLEILIYIVSLMAEKMERGEDVDRTFAFTAGDFFRVAGISDGGSAYERIEGALKRLKGTQILTNISTGGTHTVDAFSWVENYRIVYRNGDRRTMEKFRVTICEWLWRAVKLDKKLYLYDPKYFDLPPLEKRLYEVARAHCGNQGFRIWLDHLQRRIGSEREPRKFKAELKKIKRVPGYFIFVRDCLVLNTGKRGRPAKRAMAVFVKDNVPVIRVLEREAELELME
jgi:plasmid replication initiation protein